MKLRYYQQEAVDAVVAHVETKTTNPCVEIPTGGGKTPVIATLCRLFVEDGFRVLVLAHRKELLEQTAEKLEVWAPGVRYGIFSAGTGRKETDGDVVVAGIQSIFRDATKLGKIDFVLVDEAHLIPPGEDRKGGMWRTALDDLRRVNPDLTVIGFTATPYRLGSGAVCGPENVLNEICYRVETNELIDGGYLAKLVSKAPTLDVDFSKIAIRRGEFDAREVEEKMSANDVVKTAARNIVRFTANRKSVLIFCCSVAHCEAIAAELARQTGDADAVAVVVGSTPSDERERVLRRFKGESPRDLLGNAEPPLKYLCNVDVLTTGFDARNVDCVVMLRPTQSPGLYYQTVGRGLRTREGKSDCLVLDFTDNMRRFGPIDALRAPDAKSPREKSEPKTKACPRCFDVVGIATSTCKNCGFRFEPPESDFRCPTCGAANARTNRFCRACGAAFPLDVKHSGEPDFNDAILSSEREAIYSSAKKTPDFREPVEKAYYLFHQPKDPNKPPCLMCVYKTTTGTSVSDFVCFEHAGWARANAVAWWRERSRVLPVPTSVRQALDAIKTARIAEPESIVYSPAPIEPGKKTYPKFKSAKLGPIPELPTRYARTDDPLNIACDDCGARSFLWRRRGDARRVYCASCGALLREIAPTFYDDAEFFRRDVAYLEDELGIYFIEEDKDFDEY